VGPIHTLIASGTSVSDGFVLPGRGRYLVLVSSGVAASVRYDTAVISGGPYLPTFRDDGSGLVAYISSGPSETVGFLPVAPTPWGRFTLGAPTDAPRSVAIYPVK
jgi:hypothetical protein